MCIVISDGTHTPAECVSVGGGGDAELGEKV